MDCKVTFQFGGAYIQDGLYIWHLKGVKKSNDLVVTLKGINSFLPIPEWAFPKALDELENCGMIKTIRQWVKVQLYLCYVTFVMKAIPLLYRTKRTKS